MPTYAVPVGWFSNFLLKVKLVKRLAAAVSKENHGKLALGC